MEYSYVMANIKIPIIIKQGNHCEPQMNLLNMDFTPLDKLPEVMTDPLLQKQLEQNLYIFLNNRFPEYKYNNTTEGNMDSNKDAKIEDTINLYIDKTEIKKMKKPINTTFKTYHQKSRKKYTVKTYDNNGL